MTLHPDEQAREWLIRQDGRFHHESYMPGTVAELAALLARVRKQALEEAAVFVEGHPSRNPDKHHNEDCFHAIAGQLRARAASPAVRCPVCGQAEGSLHKSICSANTGEVISASPADRAEQD